MTHHHHIVTYYLWLADRALAKGHCTFEQAYRELAFLYADFDEPDEDTAYAAAYYLYEYKGYER